MILIKQRWLIFLIFTSLLWGGCECSSKKLLKKAEKELILAKQAEKVSYTEALDHYQRALEQIEKILNEYPSSNLAVEIASGKKHINLYTHSDLKDKLFPMIKNKANAETDLLAFALFMANQINDAKIKSKALIDIAGAYAEAGYSEKAAKIYIQASVETGKCFEITYKTYTLKEIAAGLEKVGYREIASNTFNKALDAAHEIEKPLYEKINDLRDIASAYAKAGYDEKASKIFIQAADEAKEIESAGTNKPHHFMRIASACAEAGYEDLAYEIFIDAVNSAHELDPKVEEGVLGEIASLYVKTMGLSSNFFIEILNIVQEIQSPGYKYGTLRQIASIYIKSDGKDINVILKIIEIARSFKESKHIAMYLESIASFYSQEEGKNIIVLNKMLEVANEIDDILDKSRALKEISRAYANADMLYDAYKIANSIQSRWHKGEALSKIAIIYSKKGMLDKALKNANNVEHLYHRYYALNEISSAYAETGNKEKASKIFVQALDSLEKGVGDNSWKMAQEIQKITYNCAKVADNNSQIFNKMLEVTKGIKIDKHKATALEKVISAYSKVDGKDSRILNAMLEITTGIDEPELKASCLYAIATAYARAEMFDQAMEIAKSIQSVKHKTNALREIAFFYAERGDKKKSKDIFNQALDMIRGIEDDRDKADALEEIASAYAHAGFKDSEFFNRMLEIVEENKYLKSHSLKEITSAYLDAGGNDSMIFEKILEIAKKIGPAIFKPDSLQNIGSAFAEKGYNKQASIFFIHALDANEAIEDYRYCYGRFDGKGRKLFGIIYNYTNSGGKDSLVFFRAIELVYKNQHLEIIASSYADIGGKDKKVFIKMLEKMSNYWNDDSKFSGLASVALSTAKSGIEVDEEMQKVLHEIIASLK